MICWFPNLCVIARHLLCYREYVASSPDSCEPGSVRFCMTLSASPKVSYGNRTLPDSRESEDAARNMVFLV